MHHRLFPRLFALGLIGLPWASSAVNVVNEGHDGNIDQHWVCQRSSDIFVSPMAGFLAVVISEPQGNEGTPAPSGPSGMTARPAIAQTRHLPVSGIIEIDQDPAGIYIEWPSMHQKGSTGLVAITLFVPSAVMSGDRVIDLLRSCQTAAAKLSNPEVNNARSADQASSAKDQTNQEKPVK
jgi:hypothetical protein